MDKKESRRALELRNRILDMGYPCAVSFPPFAVDHLKPVLYILSFQDAVDVVRSSPLDDVPALVVGSGFINSLFNTEQCDSEEALLTHMEEYLFQFLHTEKTEFYNIPGYFLPNGFIITDLQIYYRLSSLDLTEREQRILRLILFSPNHLHSYRRIEAYTFPYPYHENVLDVTNTITSQISSINRKAMEKAGVRLVKYHVNDHKDGYMLHIQNVSTKRKTDCDV